MPLDTASEERLTLVLSAQGGSYDDDCCAMRGDMSCADGYTLHDTGTTCAEWWDWVRIMLASPRHFPLNSACTGNALRLQLPVQGPL